MRMREQAQAYQYECACSSFPWTFHRQHSRSLSYVRPLSSLYTYPPYTVRANTRNLNLCCCITFIVQIKFICLWIGLDWWRAWLLRAVIVVVVVVAMRCVCVSMAVAVAVYPFCFAAASSSSSSSLQWLRTGYRYVEFSFVTHIHSQVCFLFLVLLNVWAESDGNIIWRPLLSGHI